MISNADSIGGRACWFVGATYSGTDDQMPQFIEEGIWVNGYKQTYHCGANKSFPPWYVYFGAGDHIGSPNGAFSASFSSLGCCLHKRGCSP